MLPRALVLLLPKASFVSWAASSALQATSIGFELATEAKSVFDMKIPFIAWLEAQGLDGDSQRLFEECFVCYRAGAYRAALIFTYLGLMRVLAQRLLTAVRPKSFPEVKWNDMLLKVRDEDRWEPATFDCVLLQLPQPMFQVDQDIRDQLVYWRGRRNDAAHWKGSEISEAHVESFWLFVRSHLQKIHIVGGYEALFLQFERHFDPRYTPPGAGLSKLVVRMSSAIRPANYPNFIDRVVRLTRSLDESWKRSAREPLQKETSDFVGALLQDGDEKLMGALVEVLKRDEELLVSALFAHDRLVAYLPQDQEFIRRLWYDVLPFRLVFNDWSNWEILRSVQVFVRLLAAGMIPEDQWKEAVSLIVSRLDEGEPRGRVPVELFDLPEDYGFKEAIYRHSVNDGQWAADNIFLVCEYAARVGVDRALATRFVAFLSEQTVDSSGPLDDFLGIPEDLVNLGMWFRRHREVYDQIVAEGRRHNLKYQTFASTMNPEWG